MPSASAAASTWVAFSRGIWHEAHVLSGTPGSTRVTPLPAYCECNHGPLSSVPARKCGWPVASERKARWHEPHICAVPSAAGRAACLCAATLAGSSTSGATSSAAARR